MTRTVGRPPRPCPPTAPRLSPVPSHRAAARHGCPRPVGRGCRCGAWDSRLPLDPMAPAATTCPRRRRSTTPGCGADNLRPRRGRLSRRTVRRSAGSRRLHHVIGAPRSYRHGRPPGPVAVAHEEPIDRYGRVFMSFSQAAWSRQVSRISDRIARMSTSPATERVHAPPVAAIVQPDPRSVRRSSCHTGTYVFCCSHRPQMFPCGSMIAA